MAVGDPELFFGVCVGFSWLFQEFIRILCGVAFEVFVEALLSLDGRVSTSS